MPRPNKVNQIVVDMREATIKEMESVKLYYEKLAIKLETLDKVLENGSVPATPETQD